MSLEIEEMTGCFTQNDPSFLLKQAVDFYKQAQITKKTREIPVKHSQNLYFQTL